MYDNFWENFSGAWLFSTFLSVQIFDFNFALEKPAFQSSTDSAINDQEVDGAASLAVDGDVHTCSRTGNHFVKITNADLWRKMINISRNDNLSEYWW